MQGSGWLSVLGRIPVQKHDCLVIVTTTGAEIVLREIVRVENDFVILRGRMAGSTDEGRVIILPFDQVAYFAFNKLLPEAEMQAMFGKSATSAPWPTTSTRATEAPAPGETPEPRFAGSAPWVDGPRSESSLAQETDTSHLETAPAQGADANRSDGPVPTAPLPGGKATGKPAHPSKSLLLARLRARLANDDAGPLGR